MQHLVRWFLFFLMVFLAGCASNIKLDPTTKPRLDAGVAINPIVAIADQPYFFGRAQTWGIALGALGGPVGGAIGGGVGATAARNEPEKIKQYLAAKGIDVSSIVLEEFTRQIKNRPDFADRIRDDGRFQMQLEILMYGISVPSGFSSDYKPVLSLRASLMDPDGGIIWQSYDWISPKNSKTNGHPYDRYFDNPETFKTVFKSAAEIVVSLVLEKLE
ncbi:MAG: hypothetical protein KF888_08065 [Nitrosomonas sp.]|nr:hypothetical protein [Nitrosomonas sp.]